MVAPEYRILGSLEVVVGNEPVAVATKPRLLLALLLLNANRVVPAERLIDDLWEERPPETAANTLQAHVSQLRRSLALNGDLITQAPGYVLRVEPEQLDLHQFERLVADARAASVVRDHAAAAAKLREALALWRGPALTDVAPVAAIEHERTRLDELRLAALEERFQAELAIGASAEVVAELDALTREHPFRERLWAQLMLALYRAGRQTEALDAYRRARFALVESVGVEPGNELQDLERAILRHDPKLAAPRRAARASALPALPTSLVGRQRELEHALALADDPFVRLLTLTGPGGIGKTRLAIELARRLEPEFADGAAFVPLAPIVDAELVLASIVQALELPNPGGVAAGELLRRSLADRPVLLVLDNFEQVLGAGPDVAGLIAGAPLVQAIVTSRAALRVAGEHEFVVPPLPEEDARDLFVQRARATNARFDPTNENEAVLGELCRRLDGLPLAIELAAARMKLLDPAALLARLGNRLDVLGSGSRDAPARQRTLRATIDWSYDLLEPTEQFAFARLAAFAGGWELDAAEAVCGQAESLLADLESLVDKSLVLRSADGRFSMLETVRQYALERLDAAIDAPSVRLRHAEYFLEIARQGEQALLGAQAPEWAERFDAEHDNLRAALSWSLAVREHALALRLVTPLVRYWHLRGHFVEGRAWLVQVLAVTGDEADELRAPAFHRASVLARSVGRDAEAIRFADESLRLYRLVGDLTGQASALMVRGCVDLNQGDPRGGTLVAEAAELFRATGERHGRVVALTNLMVAAMARGDGEEALRLGPQCLELARELGNAVVLALAAFNCALSEALLGRYDEARGHLTESIRASGTIGYREEIVYCLLAAGLVAAGTGQADRAATLVGALDEIALTSGTPIDRFERALRERLLGDLRLVLGEDRLAAQLHKGSELSLEAATALALTT